MEIIMLLLFAPVPCFLLLSVGTFLVRNRFWLFAWITYSVVLTANVAHSLDGVIDGMASGPVIALVLIPMILAIIVSFIPALIRIESNDEVALTKRNLTFPLVYAVIVGGLFLRFSNAF